MKIIFSRKGFDSAAGGGASPIVEGRPISLPIPAGVASQTRYGDLGLGDYVKAASRGRYGSDDLCHHDPMFFRDDQNGSGQSVSGQRVSGQSVSGQNIIGQCLFGQCLFGQCGAAQTHLANQQVGIGDVFLFFGLFEEEQTGERHHRIFGYLKIEAMIDLTTCQDADRKRLVDLGHPHALAMHGSNDMIYTGKGCTARRASPALRLTVPGGPPSLWQRPPWLRRGELSYHGCKDRWLPQGRLRSVARGQEFVADIGTRRQPRDWLAKVLAEIEGGLGG